MSTAGPNSPSAASGWTNSSNVYSQDSVYATNSVTASSDSATLLVQGFGFSLTAGATINGYTVVIWRRCSGNYDFKDQTIQLLNSSGTPTGDNKKYTTSSWPYPTNASRTYGSSSDVWGTSFTTTDTNSSSFGVKIVAHNNEASTTVTGSVDYVSITIDYTDPAGQPMVARSRLVPFVRKSQIGW